MTTTWKSEFLSFLAIVSPAKPQPTIITLFFSILGMFIIITELHKEIQSYSNFKKRLITTKRIIFETRRRLPSCNSTNARFFVSLLLMTTFFRWTVSGARDYLRWALELYNKTWYLQFEVWNRYSSDKTWNLYSKVRNLYF